MLGVRVFFPLVSSNVHTLLPAFPPSLAFFFPIFVSFFQDYHSIYDTPSMKNDESGKWKEFLQASVLFLVLSSHDNHQQDMLFRVAEYKQLEELPAYKVRTAKANLEDGGMSEGKRGGVGGGGGGGK